MSKWISVDERLPEEPGTYLVYAKHCSVGVTHIAGFCKDCDADNWIDEPRLKGKKNCFYEADSDGCWPIDHPTYWMELPKPPREQSNGCK